MECVHEIGYIMCNNFSLSNIVLSAKHDKVAFLSLDRCIPYKDTARDHHFPLKPVNMFQGDVKFSSIYQMKMYTSSRRDDLINWMYMLIYLRQMDLPWIDYLTCMPVSSAQMTFQMALQSKEQFTLKQLAKKYDLAAPIVEIASMVDRLQFEQYPNYQKMGKLLRQVVAEGQTQPVLQWKRQQQHNEYNNIQLPIDDKYLLQIFNDCKRDEVSVGGESSVKQDGPSFMKKMLMKKRSVFVQKQSDCSLVVQLRPSPAVEDLNVLQSN